jgi:hypothetical protein
VDHEELGGSRTGWRMTNGRSIIGESSWGAPRWWKLGDQ